MVSRKKEEKMEMNAGIDEYYECMLPEGAKPQSIVQVEEGWHNFAINSIVHVPATKSADGKVIGAHMMVNLTELDGINAEVSLWMNYNRKDGGKDKHTSGTITDLLAVCDHPWGPGNGHFLTDTVEVKVEGKDEPVVRNINYGKKFFANLVVDASNKTGAEYLKLFKIQKEQTGGRCANVIQKEDRRAAREARRAARMAGQA